MSARFVKRARSTVVPEGSASAVVLPLPVCSWTDTRSTRYARKVSVEGVEVSVTTAVPLHAASARSNTPANRGTRRRGHRCAADPTFVSTLASIGVISSTPAQTFQPYSTRTGPPFYSHEKHGLRKDL